MAHGFIVSMVTHKLNTENVTQRIRLSPVTGGREALSREAQGAERFQGSWRYLIIH